MKPRKGLLLWSTPMVKLLQAGVGRRHGLRKVQHTLMDVLRQTDIPIYRKTMPPALGQARSGDLKASLARCLHHFGRSENQRAYQVLKNPSGSAMNAEELANNALHCDYLFVSATEQVSRLVSEALAGRMYFSLHTSAAPQKIPVMPWASCCWKAFTLLKPVKSRGTVYVDIRPFELSRNVH